MNSSVRKKSNHMGRCRLGKFKKNTSLISTPVCQNEEHNTFLTYPQKISAFSVEQMFVSLRIDQH